MVAPRIVEERRAELPPLRLDEELLERMGKIAEGAIRENIMRQKQADGTPLQRNKKSTQDMKIRKGWLHNGRVMSLIAAKKRFVSGRPFKAKPINNNTGLLLEPVPGAGGNPTIGQLTRWLQEPHPERNSYLGWFGLNKEARAALRVTLRDWVEDEFKKAAKRFAGKRPEFRRR